jgi:hypothetical protein
MSIYLVVKETGEYSSYDKKNLTYFTSYEDAEEFVKLQEELIKLEDTYSYRDSTCFLIEVIEKGIPSEESRQQLQTVKNTLQERLQEKEEQERQKVKEVERLINEATTTEMREVYKFMKWFDGGKEKDRFFHEKLSARIRDMRSTLRSYIYTTNDPIVVNWVSKHSMIQL